MEFHSYSFLNIIAFALPLFCLLVTWAASTAAPLSQPPSSVQTAAEVLRTRGYSLVASTLSVITASNANFSGTILAPPDFAFSFAISKFVTPNRRVPHRPSMTILLFHTLRPPLQWRNLSSLTDGNQLPTLFNGNCLFLKNSNGDVSISASKKSLTAVRIRQPDMYADDRVVVHGIDGILDPTSATKCSFSEDHTPAAHQPPRVDRKFLDHAVRAIRRRGFTVVAAAISIKRSEMLRLGTVSLFAPSDRVLFSKHGGFGFNFRSHVLPQRHRFDDLARYPPKITTFQTLAANRALTVDSVDGVVTVNGVHVNSTEVYQNRWIVVFSISESLDAPFACGGGGVQYPAPIQPSLHPPARDEFPRVEPPSPIPPRSSQCRVSDFGAEIEGGDLLCPVAAGRTLLEENESADEGVERSSPSNDGKLVKVVSLVTRSPPYASHTDDHGSGQLSVDSDREGEKDLMSAPSLKHHVNIADDLFFYS